MKQSQLKTLASAGALSNAVIVHAPLSEKWCLQFDVKQEKAKPETVTMYAKSGRVREFRSIEACLNTIKEIGLNKACIVIV